MSALRPDHGTAPGGDPSARNRRLLRILLAVAGFLGAGTIVYVALHARGFVEAAGGR